MRNYPKRGRIIPELEKKSITDYMAIRIAKATNTSPESWLNMQSNLDLWISEQKELNVFPFPVYSEVAVNGREG